MRFTRRRPAEGGDLPLTSLIDCVFLLLIYFLVTASLTAPESQLASGLRAEAAKGGRARDLAPQIVLVDMAGGSPVFTIGGRSVRTRPELESILRNLSKENGVFVKVRGVAPVSAAAAALQACKDAGFSRVSYVPAG